MKFWLVLFIVAYTSFAAARGVDLIYKNNEGVRQFKKEKQNDSYEMFMGLLAEAPYDPLIQFNLGSALGGVGEEDKAEALYKQLLKTVDQKLSQKPGESEVAELYRVKFALLYNLGVHYQTIKDVDQALKFYQQALEIMPDSKEIKINIELMMKQQSGGGGGKGDPDQKDQPQQEGDQPQGGEGEQPPPRPEQQDPSKDKKPQEFDQKHMSREDLERIMEELKQQEQNIRAKTQKKGGKNRGNDKEW